VETGERHLAVPADRARAAGGGREPAEETQPGLREALDRPLEPAPRGDPGSALRWTAKSLANPAGELKAQGRAVSFRLAHRLPHDSGYSLKGNQKVLEGAMHPLRDEQFRYINAEAGRMLELGNPVLTVDTKKKEVLGNFANCGREWTARGDGVKVNSHDFPSPELPRANPYGILDLGRNAALINVGTSHDTPAFAVGSIRVWWYESGYELYRDSGSVLITADGGGSNSYRSRLWKWMLQRFCDEIRKPVTVCHFPPGTSKWNKIEHRLFSFVSINWRARPLTSFETMINLIRGTRTSTGLTVKSFLDSQKYETGIKVSDSDFKSINIRYHDFQGDWNYTIYPRNITLSFLKILKLYSNAP
jgi:hypothetical protein